MANKFEAEAMIGRQLAAYAKNGTQNAIGKTITAYQKNVAKPAETKWYKGDMPTGREVLGRIGTISKTNKTQAMDLYSQYKALQSNRTS